MRVRIRLRHGPKLQRKMRKNQHVALALASLLTPAAVATCALAIWRLTADFNLTGLFPITSGFFSHWQVWLAGAAILQLVSIVLNRYGNSEPVLRESVEEQAHEHPFANVGGSAK